jgi:hypothetical protein
MFAQSQTSAVAAVSAKSAPDILAALKNASARTGSDFNYLLSTAMRESSLDSQAQSKSSSATGLFQFVDQTWLSLVKKFGERYGLGQYAAAIQQSGAGHYAVASADTKAAILALRKDPQVSALMAGEAANATREALQCSLGREVCDGELYAAHFLGENGAKQLIQLNQSAPATRADEAFPQAAKANRAVFYHADGAPKTVAELYSWTLGQPGGGTVQGAGHSTVAAPHSTIVAAKTQERDFAARMFPAGQETTPPALRGTEDTPASGDAPIKQPTLRGSFGSQARAAVALTAQAGTLPQSPLLLTPGVMEILASLSPTRAELRRAN